MERNGTGFIFPGGDIRSLSQKLDKVAVVEIEMNATRTVPNVFFPKNDLFGH